MNVLPAPYLLAVDWWAMGAVFALGGGALLLLLLELVPARPDSSRPAAVALAALLGGGLAVTVAREARRSLFDGMFVHDGFTVFFTLLLCAIGAVAVLLSWDYVKRTRIHHGEYYALLLCATLGMIVMAGANDLITMFLGLELMSLALYVLVGFRRGSLESNEAALKYFLLGAFASGFLLYGIALVYGATGTTHLSEIATQLAAAGVAENPLLLVGIGFLLVGLGCSLADIPLPFWPFQPVVQFINHPEPNLASDIDPFLQAGCRQEQGYPTVTCPVKSAPFAEFGCTTIRTSTRLGALEPDLPIMLCVIWEGRGTGAG